LWIDGGHASAFALRATADKSLCTPYAITSLQQILRDRVLRDLAGSTAVFDANGRVDVQPFWDLLWDPVPEVDDERFYIDKVRQLHDAAVDRRMISGPVAALVSGGNDSSANASIMARKIKEAGGRPDQLHTFTVGLREVEGDAKYNDLIYAKQVADLIGSQHHEYLMSTEEFLDIIPVTIDAMDDLVSEPSAVFLYQALKMAKDKGLDVVVTGEANDELSCGHGEMINRSRQAKAPTTRPRNFIDPDVNDLTHPMETARMVA